jgi:hypothetical protein
VPSMHTTLTLASNPGPVLVLEPVVVTRTYSAPAFAPQVRKVGAREEGGCGDRSGGKTPGLIDYTPDANVCP